MVEEFRSNPLLAHICKEAVRQYGTDWAKVRQEIYRAIKNLDEINTTNFESEINIILAVENFDRGGTSH